MIGNITTGKSFNQLLNYLYKEGQGASTVYKTVLGDTPREMASEFNRIANRRPTTEKPCKHIICSFAPEDGEVSYITKADIAAEIVKKLGYTDNQYLVVEHDRQASHHNWQHRHDHIHIVINMIGYDGQRTNDYKDKSRLERILRQLEIKYKLKQIKSSRRKDHTRVSRRPRTKAYRQFQQEYLRWEQELETNPLAPPPEEPEVQHLQSIILAAIEDKPPLRVYLARLQQLGYQVEFYKTPKGRKRLRYYLKRPENKGKFVTNLSGGSLHQLRSAGVTYNSQRDNEAIAAIKLNQLIPLENQLKLRLSAVVKYKYQWLDKKQREKILKYHQSQYSGKTNTLPQR
ncbi:MAG: relaxase/mobilization nuclease domain-containing protein [Waterburya sp.]